MARREFLRFVAGIAAGKLLAACAPSPAPLRPTSDRKVRAICFDLFTLFDPRSVIDVARNVVHDAAPELCAAWRTRQFEYSWIRAAARRYLDFRQVTEEALGYAANERGIRLSAAERRTLVGAYSRLAPWPDTRDALLTFKRAGLALAPLSNYSPPMLQALIEVAAFGNLFDALISTDAARTFKPHPDAYALGPATLGIHREEIVFAAFGGWDAAGAKWFGFPTFWVNRLGVTAEQLAPVPDGSGSTLGELTRFLRIT